MRYIYTTYLFIISFLFFTKQYLADIKYIYIFLNSFNNNIIYIYID